MKPSGWRRSQSSGIRNFPTLSSGITHSAPGWLLEFLGKIYFSLQSVNYGKCFLLANSLEKILLYLVPVRLQLVFYSFLSQQRLNTGRYL